ncbi:hypothetical protein ABPG73_014767 [Tetrahymena malaccensis]
MSLFQNCTQILMEDKFNLGRSECLINQGSPNSVSEFAQNCKNLQSDQCMDIIQFSCNGTVSNYISSNGCKSNSLFTFNFKQNRYIYRLKLTVEMIINSNQQITPTSSFLNINDNLLPYDNKDFQQFCSGGSPFYSNTFNQVIQNINQDYLNISFSALPNYSKSYNTYLKGLFLAVEYCPDNCSSCSSSGCLQCKPGYYLNNQLCVQCNLSCQTCNNSSNCLTCSSLTKYLDQQNKCICSNSKDQRNNYVDCSYQNIAVLSVQLSNTTSQLTIDLGSPFKVLPQGNNSPQQLCQNIFNTSTLILISQNSQCFINGNLILVNLELNIAQNIETSNLYVTIQGGSNQIVNYSKQLNLVSDFQDLENQHFDSLEESINQQEQQQLQVLSVQAQQTQQQIQSTLMHTHAKLIQNSVNTENNFQARFYQKYMMQKSTLQRKKTFVKLKVQGDVKQFVKKQNVEEEGGDYDQEEVTIENIQKSELAPAKQFETNTQEKPKIKTKISEEQ